MEKENRWSHDISGSKHKDISKKTIYLINQTLKNPWEDFWDRIDSILHRIIFSMNPNSLHTPELQKKIFDQIWDFLNGLFKEIHIKKFYNNIPKTNLSVYSKKNLWNQFVNNIYGKEWKIFYKDEVNGWDCYYRTVLLKNLFDILKAKWLDLQNRIFVYDENRWHSSLVIKFQWKIYLADYGLFNQIFGKMISPIEDLNWLYQKGHFTKISFNKKNDLWVRYFDEMKDFIDYISNKKINSAAIEFNPRLESGKEKNIRIQFFKKYISLRINWKENTYLLKDKFILSQLCKHHREILDCVIKWLVASKEEKQEIKIYFDMILSKIDPKKLYEVLG